jgi:hypothetical protein
VLFSAAAVADARLTPSFASVWHRAQARSQRPRRAFNLSLAAVTAALVVALGSLAVWSIFLKPSNARYEAFGDLKAPNMAIVQIARKDETPIAVRAPERRTIRVGVNRSSAPERSLIAKNNTVKTTTIDTWQSPTAALLTSPTDELFKSLPQLNQNANELKSSLPGKSNEKER